MVLLNTHSKHSKLAGREWNEQDWDFVYLRPLSAKYQQSVISQHVNQGLVSQVSAVSYRSACQLRVGQPIGSCLVNMSTETWSTCPTIVSADTPPTNRSKYYTQDPQTGLE